MNKVTKWASVLIAGIVLVKTVPHFATMDVVYGAEITSKERIDERYMIWTKDEVFQNVDSALSFKFNSADVYGKMPVGSTCDLHVNGLRLPLMSWNRNILSVENCK